MEAIQEFKNEWDQLSSQNVSGLDHNMKPSELVLLVRDLQQKEALFTYHAESYESEKQNLMRNNQALIKRCEQATRSAEEKQLELDRLKAEAEKTRTALEFTRNERENLLTMTSFDGEFPGQKKLKAENERLQKEAEELRKALETVRSAFLEHLGYDPTTTKVFHMKQNPVNWYALHSLSLCSSPRQSSSLVAELKTKNQLLQQELDNQDVGGRCTKTL